MAQSSDRIVRGLRAAGIEIDVAHLTRAPRHHRIERGQGGSLITCPLEDDPEHALRRLWTDVERLHAGAEVARPYTHVVAFGGTLPLLAAPTYAWWLDIPLITLLRGNDFDTGMFSIRRRALVIDAITASRLVCTVAAQNVERIRQLAPGTEVRWITNGIDLSTWEPLPSEQARADAWRAAHVAPDRITIGLVGQLKRKKGAVFFLGALATSRFASLVHVVLVGDAEEELLAWLAAHDGAISWTHLPFLDRYELLGYYPACDLVALPSFYDGLPNVALEAAALGIPLLASDAGGLCDLVTDGEGGFVFTAGDADACRGAIERALAAPDEVRAKLGDQVRARVREQFTAGAETAAYLRALADTA
jgi:glycosyltransferase involved in cell wall biosynthesis